MIIIRRETEKDYSRIYYVIKKAFQYAPHSNGSEQDLAESLRKSDAYIPELSLAAETDKIIVGHIMFTKVTVGEKTEAALAPLSVIPEYQRRGIGSAMIKEGHRIAQNMGYDYSIVLGSDKYYSRFGYVPAINYLIKAPFDVPSKNYMAYKLRKDAPMISGTVKYAKEFGID